MGVYVSKRRDYGRLNDRAIYLFDQDVEGRVRLAQLARASRACMSCKAVIASGARYLSFRISSRKERYVCWSCATALPHRWPCHELDRALASVRNPSNM